MKILFVGCHQVLERDEISLLTELGHDVFSYQGAYMDPRGHFSLHRPGIEGMTYHEDMAKLAVLHPKTSMPQEIVNWADVVILMHMPEWIVNNWQMFRELKKPVIWRSIGQSTKKIEQIVKFYMHEGLQVVRYSPKEHNIPQYAGEHSMIRFYKDEDDLKDWNGNEKKVVNFTQTLKGRRQFCHYEHIMKLLDGFDAKVYGPGNDDLGALNGGEVPYERMKEILRNSRVFVYGGTWPASYTLGLMEAMMVGIPVVAIGKELAQNVEGAPYMNFYEGHEIIEDGVSGFVSDDLEYLRRRIQQLLDDESLAKSIGAAGRRRAIELWSKKKIKMEWETFLKGLNVKSE